MEDWSSAGHWPVGIITANFSASRVLVSDLYRYSREFQLTSTVIDSLRDLKHHSFLAWTRDFLGKSIALFHHGPPSRQNRFPEHAAAAERRPAMLLRRAICAAWLARRWTQRRVSRCRRLRGHSHHHRLWHLMRRHHHALMCQSYYQISLDSKNKKV